MNYNYPQPQFQPQMSSGYGVYRPGLQYPWTQPQVTSNQQVRPVSSIEEVKACPIDFDGSVFYFADVANKRIYTKQINLDGTASIYLYELKEFPVTPPADQQFATSYVTKQEFEATIAQLKSLYEQKPNPLKEPVVLKENIIKEEVSDELPAAQPIQQSPTFSF